MNCSNDGSCQLCGDVAVPARVIAVDAATAMATVEADGARAEVAIDLVERVRIGDLVLVHQGFAITRVEAP